MSRLCRSILFTASLLASCGGCRTLDTVFSGAALQPGPQAVARTVRVVLPSYFSEVEKLSVMDGLLEWDSAMNGALRLEFEPEPDAALSRMTASMLVNDVWSKEFHTFGRSAWAEGCTHEVFFVRVTSDDDVVVTKDRTHWLGWTVSACHRKYVALVLDKLDTPGKFQNTVVHEFGHALGMDHVLTKNVSVMYPYVGGETQCLTLVDRAVLCDLLGCAVGRTREPINCE